MEDLKGVRMQRYNVWRVRWWEVYKCGRFKGSEDVKVLCQEEAMVGCNKCTRFKGSEDDAMV